MKAPLKKLVGLAALGLTLLPTTVPPWAGEQRAEEVVVDVVYKRAGGSMVGARYSADPTQGIGCAAFASTLNPWISCAAKDSAGNALACWSNDQRFLEAVQGMTDASYISFQLQENSSECLSITVRNNSFDLR